MRINQGLLITIATVVIPVIIQLIYIRYVSYEVSPETFGYFSLLLTLVAAVSSTLITIPNTAFVRYFNETSNKHNFINEFRTLLIPINFISFVVIVIYAYFMPQYSFEALALLYTYLVLQNNISLNRQIVLQNIERKKFFLINLLEKSSKYFFPILLFYFFTTLESLISGLLLGAILLTLLIMHFNKRYTFRITFEKRKLKIYFLYSYPIIFTAVFSWIIIFSDRYFINYFLDVSSVGIYSILAQVAAFTSILNALFSMYVNPIIYRMYSENKDKAIAKLFYYIKFYALFIIILLIVAIALPKSIYTILINPEVVNNSTFYYTLLVLILGSVFSILQNALSLFFTLTKRLSILGTFWFFAAIVNLTGNFFIKEFGIIAAAISTAASYGLVMILNYIWIQKNYKNGKVNLDKFLE